MTLKSGHSPGTATSQVLENTPAAKRAQDTESRAAVGQQLLNVGEAGVFLRVSPWTIRELIWRGDLPHVRVGRLLRVDRRDLETFIARNRFTSPS